MRPLPPNERRDDPYYAHFPELKAMLLESVRGRRSGELRKYAEDSSLMNEWHTDMRYAPSKDIKSHLVERWRDAASRLVNAMDAE